MKKIISTIGFVLIATMLFSQQIKSIKITELENTIATSKTPLIVNFWATYCIPCIEEIPYFLALTKKYKSQNVSLLFVSLDLREAYPSKIAAATKKLKMDPPGVWLNETNADYFLPKIDSAFQGGLPSSLFINNTTGYRKFYEEQLTKEKLEKEIQAMIAGKNSNDK